MKKRFLTILTIFVTSLTLSACGGGGDRTINSGNYSSNSAHLAKPTYENALKVQEAIFDDSYDNSGYSSRKLNKDRTKAKPFALKIAKEFIELNNNNSPKKRLVSNICESGTLDVEVISQTSDSVTKIYRYNNCYNAGLNRGGDIKVHLYNKRGGIYRNQDIIFISDYKKIYNGTTTIVESGSIIKTTITSFNNSNRYNFRLDYSMSIDKNGYRYGYKDVTLNYIINGATYWYQTKGKIYINNFKEYVTYDRSYNMYNSAYRLDANSNPIYGEARYNMADGAILRIIADNGSFVLDIN